MKAKRIQEILGFNILRLCIGIVIFALVVILYDIAGKGYSVISWKFLTSMPRRQSTSP